ncbi:hypothetical protein P7D15_00705 [Bacillus cereus]|nr:hypothetical protein [Bacillus cereus]MDF9598967.1 hypothetical protein [Bacillus cereus]MDG1589300.1 hypothetical protein [Bacillus cereus]
MTEKERLLAKSDGVKDCVKHLKKKIKAEQRLVNSPPPTLMLRGGGF